MVGADPGRMGTDSGDRGAGTGVRHPTRTCRPVLTDPREKLISILLYCNSYATCQAKWLQESRNGGMESGKRGIDDRRGFGLVRS